MEVKAGDLTRQLPVETLDLCEDCSALFLDWLRSGHQANHAGGWPALDVKPHGLPMATAQSD